MTSRRPRLLVLAPLLVFGALGALFAVRLVAGADATLPSALLGREAPPLDLPALPGLLDAAGRPVPGLDGARLRAGKPTLVNVFASWCVPCRDEHPLLMRLAGEGVPILGLNHKDEPENARRFLGALGNPYAAVGADRTGRTSIDWGVYGVPETFVVDGAGRIVHKHVGPLDQEALRGPFGAALARARGAAAP